METILDYHLCTWDDLKDFPEPTLDSQRVLNAIMNNPKRGLFCFDWDKLATTLEIWGVSQYNDFRFIDLELLPCQYNHTFTGRTDDVIPE